MDARQSKRMVQPTFQRIVPTTAASDYSFGCVLGWDALDVVRFHGVEELSRPYEYDIVLRRDPALGPVDLDAILDTGATLHIATVNRTRALHGIIAEAHEIERTAQMILYRVLLVPPLWRLRYRRRTRTYVKKTIAEIIASVLQNNLPELYDEDLAGGAQGMEPLGSEARLPPSPPAPPAFVEPRAFYAIDVLEPLFHDRDYRFFVVQYNDSDLDLLSRLMEELGATYWFEHAEDGVVLRITDGPGADAVVTPERSQLLRTVQPGGTLQGQELLRSLRQSRRMRSRAVEVQEFDPVYPLKYRGDSKEAVPGAGRTSEHSEWKMEEHWFDAQNMGALPARVRLERFEAERAMAEGAGNVRTLEPGRVFTMQDADGLRDDAEYLVVRVECYATQQRPQGTALDEEPFGFTAATAGADFDMRFRVLPRELPFRPARLTRKNLIAGVQQAVVTAEEFDEPRPEINCDYDGSVRVRFKWDRRPEEKGIPSSEWIYVSQAWAGPGYGAMHNPRVGHSVYVAFRDGDPEFPVVIGRTYSNQHPSPYDATAQPTISTLRSKSSPNDDGFNELRFEDLTKKEQIYLHAQRNLDEVVRASHTTSVGGDQTNSVGGNRTHSVQGWETVTVGGDRTTLFKSSEDHTVLADRTTIVTAVDDLWCGERKTHVKGSDALRVDAARSVTVHGEHTVHTDASYTSTANANHTFTSTHAYFFPSGEFQCVSTTAGFTESASFFVKAAGATLSMSAGLVTIDNGAGASIMLLGNTIILGATTIMLSASGSFIASSGGSTCLTAGGDINAAAATIKLNG